MGTRSDIIAQLSNGKWARIYCHWDGYLDHNGRILFDHYKTQEKIDQLMALGDLSILNEEIGVKHPFEAPSRFTGDLGSRKTNPAYTKYQKKYGKMCLAYGRDRGETGTEAKIGDTLSEVWPEIDTWTEFTYVWFDGKWSVGDPDEGSQTLIDLGDALEGKKTLRPLVKTPFGVIGRHSGKV